MLGTCVAGTAEGVKWGLPWGEATIALLLREVLCGSFCTALLGAVTSADHDLHHTLSTLRFLRYSSRLSTRVRAPQPTLSALMRRLRALEVRFSTELAEQAERRPPFFGKLASPPALFTGDTAPSPTLAARAAECLREVAVQLGAATQQREHEASRLQAQVGAIRAALSDSGWEQPKLPWQEPNSRLGGVAGSRVVLQRMQATEARLGELEQRLNVARRDLKQLDTAVLTFEV